ncbi:MAG: ribonuclease [Pseudomonadota bacterium]|nr:ribonuclease [Pseudomonadota bacterium]
MPSWLVERGIGETRSVLVEGGEILEARVLLEGTVPAGTVLQAVLKQSGRPALAVAGKAEFLLPGGAPGVTEGAGLCIEVTREAIPGAEPWKRPLARVAEGPARPVAAIGGELLAFPGAHDRLEQAGWSDLLDEARSGIVRFAGGELRVSPTPAMTLIDVDGHLPPPELALAGAVAAALTIRRHGIGGSIGVDLPTLASKAQRQAVAAAIDTHLPQPFERTAMNGFGFIQIVRPRRHASVFELAQERAAFEARALLRRAAFEAGARRLAAHPAVIAVIEARHNWIEALARQVGGAVTLRSDASIPIHGGYAESL